MKASSTMMVTLSPFNPIPLDAPRFDTRLPLLQVQGLSKRYGSVIAIDNVDLIVYPGEVLGIVGESGSGKSTVLRMLNLEEMPDTGMYTLGIDRWKDANLFGLSRFDRRTVQTYNIGIVYQNPYIGLRMR